MRGRRGSVGQGRPMTQKERDDKRIEKMFERCARTISIAPISKEYIKRRTEEKTQKL